MERTVLVGGSIDWANYDGHRKRLSTDDYGDGTIDPHGYRHMQSFALDGSLPVLTFTIGDALVERRIHGSERQLNVRRLSRIARQQAAGPGDSTAGRVGFARYFPRATPTLG